MYILEKNKNKIDWMYLSANPNAIDLLEKNNKIDWTFISSNPNIFKLKFE